MGIQGIVTTTVITLALIIISTTAAAAISCGSALNASTTPIQAAVDNATAGETICAPAESYTENHDLKTPHLTLAGEGAADIEATQTELPQEVSTDWWTAVQEDIRKSEYDVTWQEETQLPDINAAYQAPNRAHNLRTYFTPDSIRITPRTSTDWVFGLSLVGYGFADDVRPVSEAEMSVSGNRVEYQRGCLTEWYVNSEDGLEQGFTIDAPPASGSQGPEQDSWIAVKMDILGDLDASLNSASDAIDLTTTGGVGVLRYSKLHAIDAMGRELDARLTLLESGIEILVDTSGAVYPITIDPLAQSPAWTAESNQSNAYFGVSVASAGDVNGDGCSDVIVGAYYYDNGETDEGRAYVYHGSATGLSTGSAWTAESNQSNAQFGISVASAGDVNGDGYSDVIVGAHLYDNGETDEGRAYVYHGSATGLSTGPAWTAESNQSGAYFCFSVAGAGDLNGDGYSDVIVGAYRYDNGETYEGRAYVYHGSAAGLSTGPAWTAESNQSIALFGCSVASAGDVNGDGYSDVIVGADHYDNGETDEGRAYVYHGSAAGLSTGPAWTAESNQSNAYFGRSVASASDVNGDGYSDVIVGAFYYDNGETDEGRAYVYHGSAAGLSTGPVWTAESNQSNAYFGISVASAGDVNGDGYSDVIVGAHPYDNGETDEGRAYVYHGSAAGLSTGPAWTAESNQSSAYFGYSVASAGDVNGDGYSDVIIGAHHYDNGETGEGRAYVYHGSAAGLSTGPAWTAESNQSSAYFGYSVASAGDVNGDGYSDVMVGAYHYDNGETDEGRAYVYHGSATGLSTGSAWTAECNQSYAYFGFPVASAGDVNGDGYSDVMVGAHGYDNGETNEGRAYVYHGSATGLSTGSAWTAESNQSHAQFGVSVAGAGDVNGDGYSDVMVGAYIYDNGETDEGRAYLYHGSATGLSTSPAWTAESNQSYAVFGRSVASAGDVNGDGYSDVIVGAPLYDNGETDEGRAYLYHGSAAGLSTSPAWTAESNQSNAYFGISVAGAGDVNGDGYSDVIVGAHLYDNGETYEGRAYVYHGSATGLSTGPAWTAESNQSHAVFGRSVASAGDVNGDGYSDVIVGAYGYDNGETNEGRAYVYHGSATGLSTSPAWTAESNQSSAWFGYSVASAGDVNGDGYSDVIVGAYGYNNGQTDEGRAYLYHGSATGLSTSSAWTAESNQSYAYFGISVASAGDVNGDGYSDVIVGAYHYDNGETNEGRAYLYHGSAAGLSTSPAWTAESNQSGAHFGWSVASAGDVNGDGYSDVIIGAQRYDNGETDEGRAYLYHGSSSGLSTGPAWTAESNQNYAYFSYPVASAGDVNGDGYSDVIVGAFYYDNGETNEGRAYVYHGSATGLSTGPAWTAESNQNGACFGYSVASSGDVNGDGYSDVIVGTPHYDNGQTDEGRAYVYHGSAAGLSTGPAWTAESNQSSAQFGYPVASAGDVNGDGYSDVIVGAYYYDNSETDEGGAYVYHGSAAGLSTGPAWTAESNQSNAYFGYPVASAGDVNGDGYSDVIIGARQYDNGETDEGRAYLYHGSATGLSTSSAWTAESNQSNAYFGSSVASAGDVNGDGYSDVIVGAYSYDNGETDEGRAYVYYGNGGSGLSLIPAQRKSDNSAPIAHLGRSDSMHEFRLTALGRTPYGRSKVKLEWEVKPMGTPFDGTGTQKSASWIDTGTAGASLNELVSSLTEDTCYHWRMRLLYHPVSTPFQQHSRWLSSTWNGPEETDLRTPPANYIPPDPVNLANTTGGGYLDYWVNYTWSAGTGNVTDSYNVTLNGAWTNGTAATFMNVSVSPCEWANITVFAYNASGTGTLSEGSVSDEVQAPCDVTPPDPTNLANTTGGGYLDYWVNYTWSAGTGNMTDSYNVTLNGAWTNGTAATFMNVSVSPCEWANITVFAYNASGTGTLSEGSVRDEVQAPCDVTPPVIIITTPEPNGIYIVGMELDFSATDDESGVATVVGNLTNTSGVSQLVDSGSTPAVGVYTLVVTATDNASNTNESDPVFFVVYNPAGGRATGEGWFDPDGGGKADFEFTARYKNDVSTGKLDFKDKDADIKLKSTSINWLVISSVSAQFQGTGTINGEGLYTFRVQAKDNGKPGAGVDYFDIKIWNGTDMADLYYKANNTIVDGDIKVLTKKKERVE